MKKTRKKTYFKKKPACKRKTKIYRKTKRLRGGKYENFGKFQFGKFLGNVGASFSAWMRHNKGE